MRLIVTGGTPHACQFQSTHPVWDATGRLLKDVITLRVSIHASRMGCDIASVAEAAALTVSIHASRMGCDKHNNNNMDDITSFNPRIPYGMRLKLSAAVGFVETFQSTHPVWDATSQLLGNRRLWIVSIHASRMGCDTPFRSTLCSTQCFNPRIPYGMRLYASCPAAPMTEFQSTHPVWDATVRTSSAIRIRWSFNPRIPYGMRRLGS